MKGVLQKVFKNPKTSTYENDPPIRAELYSVEPLEEFAAGYSDNGENGAPIPLIVKYAICSSTCMSRSAHTWAGVWP